MIMAGIRIEELECKLTDSMTEGRLPSSIELKMKAYLDELEEPVFCIFKRLDCLREDIQLSDWGDNDGVFR